MTIEGTTWMTVKMSPELAATLFTRDERGNRLQVNWGTPDADGFFTPTVTVDTADNLLGDLCGKLAAWAEAAQLMGPRGVEVMRANPATEPYALHSRLTVQKSDLLGRLIYGREKGPSQTPCPVHEGVWSGCHGPWPGWVSRGQKPDGSVVQTYTLEDCEPMIRKWWELGCRCATHKGSSCTNGWNPDKACGCVTA